MEREQPRHPALPPKKQAGGKRPPVTAQALLEASPWLPAPYEIADVTAIQALQRGDASADMQKRALRWIIHNLCGTYDLAYRATGARDTDFALGKQACGQQIVKLANLNLAALRRDEVRADPPEG